jgi:hypothetical protein
MASFNFAPADRDAYAKVLGWEATPKDQAEWDTRLHKTVITVDEGTTKYVGALCNAGWDAQSGAERSYVARHSGSCPWKSMPEKDRQRAVRSTDPAERAAARREICTTYWNPSGPTDRPNPEEEQFLRSTGGVECQWSDVTDAWKKAAVAESGKAGTSPEDPRWKPVFEAVCKRLPWERTGDEQRIVANLCGTQGGVCLPCERVCATSSPERTLAVIGVVMFLIMFLMVMLK